MRPRDEGTIVQVGSALAYRGIPLQSAYCGAKHAIKGFTESVRTELIHDDSDVQLSMVQMRDRTGYRRNAVSSGSGSAPTQAATSATAFVSKTK